MKTTIDIDDTVLQALREEAARRRTTMSALVEEGLRRILLLEPYTDSQPVALPPLPSWRGGEMLVDVRNRDELYEVMEESLPCDRL